MFPMRMHSFRPRQVGKLGACVEKECYLAAGYPSLRDCHIGKERSGWHGFIVPAAAACQQHPFSHLCRIKRAYQIGTKEERKITWLRDTMHRRFPLVDSCMFAAVATMHAGWAHAY